MFDLSTEYAGEILPRVIHVIQLYKQKVDWGLNMEV